jgi:hypothetical protein
MYLGNMTEECLLLRRPSIPGLPDILAGCDGGYFDCLDDVLATSTHGASSTLTSQYPLNAKADNCFGPSDKLSPSLGKALRSPREHSYAGDWSVPCCRGRRLKPPRSPTCCLASMCDWHTPHLQATVPQYRRSAQARVLIAVRLEASSAMGH